MRTSVKKAGGSTPYYNNELRRKQRGTTYPTAIHLAKLARCSNISSLYSLELHSLGLKHYHHFCDCSSLRYLCLQESFLWHLPAGQRYSQTARAVRGLRHLKALEIQRNNRNSLHGFVSLLKWLAIALQNKPELEELNVANDQTFYIQLHALLNDNSLQLPEVKRYELHFDSMKELTDQHVIDTFISGTPILFPQLQHLRVDLFGQKDLSLQRCLIPHLSTPKLRKLELLLAFSQLTNEALHDLCTVLVSSMKSLSTLCLYLEGNNGTLKVPKTVATLKLFVEFQCLHTLVLRFWCDFPGSSLACFSPKAGWQPVDQDQHGWAITFTLRRSAQYLRPPGTG
eukprot:TRINITY_DN22301_c0_g1_i1.p1 TRINITY_DN22301_c0_g1~~TRINITY_DN22301_c0_g1_i1.p1  ORF type:complete len:355 (-),score=3.64 TRINITY_DN22301_c0_g1_i1:69-1091(-)